MPNIANSVLNCQQVSLNNSSLPQNLNENALNKESDLAESFPRYIESVAVRGSGIPPALWALNTGFLANEAVQDSEWAEVSHPLYEVLGKPFRRFSHNAPAKAREFGIGLFDYRDRCWQVIQPPAFIYYKDDDKGQKRKEGDFKRGYGYVAPFQSGNRAFFPALNEETIEAICKRYGIDRASIGADYWADFKQSGTPLHVTEGGKKALSILGQGYLSCAVFGQNCLGSPDLQGWPVVHIALDQDSGITSKGESKAANNRKAKLSGLRKLRKSGATVRFVEWHPRDGKGADDLLVNSSESFHKAFSNPQDRLCPEGGELTRSDIQINQRYLDLNLDAVAGKAIGIRSPKGTGKSQLIQQWIAPRIAEGAKILGITHRVSLGQACGDRWGLPWIAEDRGLGQGMICIHSLHSQCKARFNPESWHGAIVLIDEITQVFKDAVHSAIIENLGAKIMAEILRNIKAVCQNASKLVVLDADLGDDCIRLLTAWGIDTTTIENAYSPEPFPIHSFDKPDDLLSDLLATIASGGKSLVLCDSQKNELRGKGKAGGKFSTQAVERRIYKECPGATVLRVDAETLADKNHPAFQCLRYEGEVLRLARLCLEYDAVIASPSINTGVDLSGIAGHFSGAYAFFSSGTLPPSDGSQFLSRLRDDRCPRKICIKSGFNRNLSVGNGGFMPQALIEGCKSSLRASLEVLTYAQEGTTIDASWLDYWAKTGAINNQASLDYRQSCYQWLIREGHEILEDIPRSPAVDDETQSQIALEIAEERAEAVRQAEDISPSMAETLSRKESIDKEERASLEKFKLHSRYGQEVNGGLQLLDSVIGYSSLRLGWLLTNAEAAKSADIKLAEDIGESGWLPTTARKSVWGKIRALQALDISRLLSLDEFCQGDLKDVFQKALDCRKQIKDLLGIGLNEKSRAIPFIRELGKRIGRKLILARRSGNDRFYKFAPIDALHSKIFAYWDAKAEEQKTVSKPDTKCVISGKNILPTPSNDAKLIPILAGAWAGLKGRPEGAPFQGLTGEWRQILSIEGMGCKSIPISELA